MHTRQRYNICNIFVFQMATIVIEIQYILKQRAPTPYLGPRLVFLKSYEESMYKTQLVLQVRICHITFHTSQSSQTHHHCHVHIQLRQFVNPVTTCH